jgi:hypothetical protein
MLEGAVGGLRRFVRAVAKAIVRTDGEGGAQSEGAAIRRPSP